VRTATGLALCLVLAGCNSILDNRDFTTSDAGIDCARLGRPPTTLLGTVFAPNQSLPINNALVYVPTAALADIPDGPSGPTCASGAPAVSAFSDTKGNFKLQNVPAGSNVRLVIQVGKWRREVRIASVPACTETAVDAGLTRLPRDSSEGHIPHIAISTGREDTLECLPRDLGIADSEITSGASATGRIRLYLGNGTSQFAAGGAFEPISPLIDVAASSSYDAILLGCGGPQETGTAHGAEALFDFTNLGGWLWLAHNELVWLTRAPPPWNSIGNFQVSTTAGAPGTALVDVSSPQGQALADWSVAAGASTTAGMLPVQRLHESCKSVTSIARRLLYLDPATGMNDVQMFTWDAAKGGGRMVFADLHLADSDQVGTPPYPAECVTPPPAQEKAIMFELFDTPTCLP
jgi:hypothetical protein